MCSPISGVEVHFAGVDEFGKVIPEKIGEMITERTGHCPLSRGAGPDYLVTIRDGRVEGYFTGTGIRPKFMEKLEQAGINLPPAIFTPSKRR